MFTKKEKSILNKILNQRLELSLYYINFYSMLGVGYEEKILRLEKFSRQLVLIMKKISR